MIYEIAQPNFLESFAKPAVKQTLGNTEDFNNLARGLVNLMADTEKSPPLMINKIDRMLKDDYKYNREDADALRHYLGMQALAEEYGPNVAEFFGQFHDLNFFLNNENVQAKVDLQNNQKALEDFKANQVLKEYDKSILDSLLKEITIPPKLERFENFKNDFKNIIVTNN